MIKYLAAALLSLGVFSTNANADNVKAGVLTCHVAPGWGVVVGSHKKASCVFTSTTGHKTHYTADITKVGLDVGYTAGKTIVWAVVALKGNGANLSGTYLGANAEATAVVGVGANALVGGLNDNFALQPVSVQGQTGINVALAVESLTLR